MIEFDLSLSCGVKCLAVKKKMKQSNQQLDFSMGKY